MITYDSITKVFGGQRNPVTALKNVSFTVDEGNVVVLLGPSGCGKTTTLRLTNRLEALSSGRITVNGQDISGVDPVKLRQSMGYIIQEIGLFPNKTIGENIAVVPQILKWDKERINNRIDELLRMVNLDPNSYRNRYPAELSGGQQQRIGVARGLAAEPEILLMDEPFGAIDPINRERIQDEFMRLQSKLKKTVIFVSHDIHEAIKVGDKIALFHEGQVVQYDTPEVLLTQPASKFVADFVGADRTLKVLGLKRVRDAVNTDPPNVIDSETSATDALKLLEKNRAGFGIVVKDKTARGYVTPKMLKHESGKAGSIAEEFPVSLEMRSPLRDALSYMLMNDLLTLCVEDENGRFAGTVSYRDIQSAILDIYSAEENEKERSL
ncbi:MAG: ABC transporter ATP-binding protein [Verrucomicrobiota bacterium]